MSTIMKGSIHLPRPQTLLVRADGGQAWLLLRDHNRCVPTGIGVVYYSILVVVLLLLDGSVFLNWEYYHRFIH
jgi:hypothetical protein